MDSETQAGEEYRNRLCGVNETSRWREVTIRAALWFQEKLGVEVYLAGGAGGGHGKGGKECHRGSKTEEEKKEEMAKHMKLSAKTP